MFDEWHTKYDRMIHHLLHKYRISYDRDDYYQLALIRLWQISQSYDSSQTKNEAHYVYIQLKFCLIDEIRRRMKYQARFLLMEQDVVPEQCAPDSYSLCQETLSPDEKEWYRLTDAGYSSTEIAGRMQRTSSQVKYIRKKAQHKLRQNNDLPF
ncbi:sigma-70 family RNA polymerase sigma factor [Macrococcus carouselicus]|uniref:Sigma-70 family RNA polymerase sigma factor n=1 Tax=Macrococcus carouselicus TaxID=69969 RepID=A0A9Q8CKC5_9STAP|nr:sigma-70 family RNA polymerase sigma factor [Macrococcus carouselicus]TDM03821.1 sigma-70 family RNA polymerase sigma factor [Macrococcus carouselicus]